MRRKPEKFGCRIHRSGVELFHVTLSFEKTRRIGCTSGQDRWRRNLS